MHTKVKVVERVLEVRKIVAGLNTQKRAIQAKMDLLAPIRDMTADERALVSLDALFSVLDGEMAAIVFDLSHWEKIESVFSENL